MKGLFLSFFVLNFSYQLIFSVAWVFKAVLIFEVGSLVELSEFPVHFKEQFDCSENEEIGELLQFYLQLNEKIVTLEYFVFTHHVLIPNIEADYSAWENH